MNEFLVLRRDHYKQYMSISFLILFQLFMLNSSPHLALCERHISSLIRSHVTFKSTFVGHQFCHIKMFFLTKFRQLLQKKKQFLKAIFVREPRFGANPGLNMLEYINKY